MVDEGTAPYRPRRALPVEFDDSDGDFDDDLGGDEPGGDDPALPRHGNPSGPEAPSLGVEPPSAPSFSRPVVESVPPSAATTPVGGARERPALPGKGYQPRHSATSTTSAPVRSGLSARPASAATPVRRPEGPDAPHPVAAPAREPLPTTLAARVAAVPRRRQALLLGAVAAALVAVLAVVYSVWALGNPPTTSGTPSPGAPSSVSASSASPSVDEGPLPTRLMMTPAQAKGLAKGTWTVVSDTVGLTEDSITGTCLGRADGGPAPEATRIRTLSTGGDRGPAAFHQTDLYPTSADAVEAMTIRTKALGDCSTQFALLLTGAVGKNLGNQAIGVTVVIQDTPTAYHAIMINRTGRLLNVVDLASTDSAAALDRLGSVLGKVTNGQCSFAVGLCATDATVTATVPPIGGDAPGFLSTADVPRVGTSTGTWTPGEPTRKPTVNTSNCEGTDFGAVKNSTATVARTYILADDPDFFGFDTVLITMQTSDAARELADDISAKIGDCSDRLLTATVSDEKSFSGTGLRDAEITGTTYVVTQKVDDGKTTLRYRVGIASVGQKVVYTFANSKAKTDFTDDQWNALNVRAGQRATQIT